MLGLAAPTALVIKPVFGGCGRRCGLRLRYAILRHRGNVAAGRADRSTGDEICAEHQHHRQDHSGHAEREHLEPSHGGNATRGSPKGGRLMVQRATMEWLRNGRWTRKRGLDDGALPV